MKRAALLAVPILAAVTGLAAGLIMPGEAAANQAEAKEAARLANCKPGKIEPIKTTTGRTGETIYKIECQGQKDVFVLVRCQGRLCTIAR